MSHLEGTPSVEAAFKVLPQSGNRLAEIAGGRELPANWRAFLSDSV